jgi:TrmH family RNA methyltransferase
MKSSREKAPSTPQRYRPATLKKTLANPMSPEFITSVQNPRIKAVAKLRDRREREARGQFQINGAREIRRAIEARWPLVEVFVCPERCTSDESRRAVAQLPGLPTRVTHVSPDVFARMAYGDRDDGLLAVATARSLALADLQLPDNPVVAVLDGVEKPGNVGAILRTADASGVSAVIVAGGTSDLFNPNCVRASLGTLFTVPVCTVGRAETLAFLRERKLAIFAARVDAQRDYTNVDYSRGCALVLGNEAAGLGAEWLAEDVVAVRIPMRGIADSLNVSGSAAVLFYEALRQRTTA